MFIAHTKIVSDLNKVSRKSRRHFKRNTFNGWACACNFLWWKSVFGTKCMKLPSTIFVEKARTVWQIHKNFGSGSIQFERKAAWCVDTTKRNNDLFLASALRHPSQPCRKQSKTFYILRVRSFHAW